MVLYIIKVLNLPYHFALLMVSVFLSTKHPPIKSVASLMNIITISAAIQRYLITRQISIAACVSLSATGSINFPKSDIMLNFLAILPSTTSVIPEIIITTVAQMYILYWQYKITITGMSNILKKLKKLGIVKMSFLFNLDLIKLFVLLHPPFD